MNAPARPATGAAEPASTPKREETPLRARRRLVIAMAQRRQRPGTGSLVAELMEGGPRVRWPDLSEVLGDLPWAVVGAVATRHYMPERSTRNLHVGVPAADAPEVRRRLTAAGWAYLGELSIPGSNWRAPTGESVDVLEGGEPWWDAALAAAQGNRDQHGLPILPLPYLVLSKLLSGRTQDIADITRTLGLADEAALSAVREIIATHAPADLEDLEALISLGQLEMGTEHQQ